MAMRFRKSVSLGKGIRLNFGKSSMGVSFGGKYGGMSVNSKTGVRARTSLPGTGISFSENLSSSSTKHIKPTARKKPMKDFEDFGTINNGDFEESKETYEAQEVPQKPRKRRGLIITICVILFLYAVGSCGDDEAKVVTTPEPTSTVAVITEKAAPTETPKPTQVPKATAEPMPEKQIVAPIVPDNEITKSFGSSSDTKSPSKPEPTKEVKQENTQKMVWIPTHGGKKYHSSASCSGMEDPQYVTIGEAQASGFTACKRCH